MRIDDMRILDITPGDNAAARPPLGEHGVLMANFVAVHTFFLVRVEREALTLLAIDDAWVDSAIGGRRRLDHLRGHALFKLTGRGQRDLA